MKNKHILYTICALMISMVSCKRDSYLDRAPLSDISPQKFFKNETDLQLYCNQYYSALPQQNFLRMDDNSDDKANQTISTLLANTYTVPSAASSTDLPGTGAVSAGTTPVAGTGTNWNFALIRTCNFFLANYSKADLPEATKNVYVGETLFFRANDFWKKVKAFGDVPYVNKYITDTSSSVLYGARMPHQQVMDSVLKDLNFAVANIPVTPSQDGRLTKYAALALKARVCLWEGTYRKYFNAGDPTPFLQGAVDAAEQIMTSGLFKIYNTGHPQTDYYNLFIQEELQGNSECILPMRYLLNILTSDIDRQLGQSGDGYSKNFVRSFLCTDGLPYSLSPLYKGDDTPDDEAQNRDPRYKQQIATRGFDLLNGDLITLPRIGTTNTSTGYQCIKGRSNSQLAWTASQDTYDFFIFRYAEILLIDAEARAELGSCTQSTLDNTINLLRDRVGMPHMVIAGLVKDPKSDFPALPVLLDEIRRERRIELGSEGFRFDDLHRWKAGTLINNPETILGMKLTPALKAQYPASQVSNITVDANNYIRVYPNFTARVWSDKLYLFPIPTGEITLNPQLKQNPGW
ncbi:Starch-binding associating with outer membrane [Pedobacter westerhofensis]|uniref:Starch-binding associating with outer membrane n=1 Tax=Pedobacter westerhofensis TaxID=425512 RepID=A0A521EST9_9SPHI|nr:RagB/SusD family nutrient uptake outer membrane protein [Pedobacter westerhofensis]SMO86977.1 Starch-binding associating with outer membrane [Pedobacter westerhofensis]